MGGGSYDMDVAHQARSSNAPGAFSLDQYNHDAQGATTARQGAHPKLEPHGNIRECANELPIVIALDVTRSRGEDTKIVYEKLPMFIGQLALQGYVPGAALSFTAIGDAHAGDKAPLQVGQFEADNRLDEVLHNFWIEEGGGGTGQESYELAAYFFARHSKLASFDRGEKGFFFFVGDEGFYPEVSRDQVRQVLGREIPENIPSATIFAELQERFHVFFVYPKKSFEQRKDDIDAEIRQRVLAAGGQVDDVDVRASLMWNNRNDLDVHVVTPSGERISFQNKQSRCGGWLDVDMNVRGESLKPVENVRWKKGEAPAGRYEIRVQNYAFHEKTPTPTPYKLELEVNGHIQHFDGVISPNKETVALSEQLVTAFDYDPAQRQRSEREESLHEEAYKHYDDEVILKQWSSVLPQGHILELDDAGALIDVVLGALAMKGKQSTLDAYLEAMASRDQSEGRRTQVRQALGALEAARGSAP